MLNTFLIGLGKALSSLSLTLNLGSGSTWPGHLALQTNPRFIRDLLKNSKTKVILIAGTNGKTTTSTLIQYILEKSGKKVFQNATGANLLNGIASTLLLNTNSEGKLDADFAIFEVDENALPSLLKEITPDTIILLNLFRDQLDRYGEVNTIVRNWANALKNLPPTSTLILNADDPEIAYLGLSCHPEQSEGSHKRDSSAKPQNDNVFYFGLDDKNLAQTNFQHASDSLYCPKCQTKLTYANRYFSHLGDWRCPKCGLKRPKLSLSTSPSYPLSGIYNMYNTNAAILFAKNNNVNNATIEQSLKDFKPAFGRQETITYYGKQIQLFLSKNPTSLNQSLRTVKDLRGTYLLLILNDRAPDGTDVSWIWDVDFEEHITPDMHIFVSGDRCYDMGLRIKYTQELRITNYSPRGEAGELRIEENLKTAIDNAVTEMPKDETLFILPTYSAMLETRKIITGRKIL